MNLRQKLYDMKDQRAQHLAAARTALEEDDMQTYKKELQAAKDMNPQIESIENLLAEETRIDNQILPPASPEVVGNADGILASREYARAFCDAIRDGATLRTARGNERYSVLFNALTETGGTPTGSDGGFLVPQDIDTAIRELRRNQLALADVFSSESVSTMTGYRVIDTTPTKGFTKVSEMATIPKDKQPKFAKISFTVEDYALRVPISNDLLNDSTDSGLMAYLARWFAKEGVITENELLLSKVASVSATAAAAGKELATIKKALNVTLDPDIAANAAFIVNQSGWNVLDNLVDNNGRPLLQPDPTSATAKMLLTHPIYCVSDTMLSNVSGSSTTSKILIGDFTQYACLFRRQPLEVATTNIGGDAWETNSTEARAIMRMDAQIFDSAAATAVSVIV